MTTRPLTVAVVGSGPAGVYTADILASHETPTHVDVFERLPVPFGLVRYGVAPDHPRIKAIVDALHSVLDRGDIRLVAGIDVGVDVSLEALRREYDAVVLATGADDDAPLPLPGFDLPGSFGAASFVSWYDAHPDAPTDWSLDAAQVAVIGAGNVALDVARMLAKHAEDLSPTEIPDHVHEALASSSVTDVHLFARRGPAEAQFSPLELRELGDVPDVDIVVDPADMVFDRSSEALIASSRQRKIVAQTLVGWSERDPSTFTASRRIHLHFMQAPVRLDGEGAVQSLTVERTRHLGNGTVEGTGETLTYPVGQVYRAVGYASRPVPGAPYDGTTHRIPHDRGRVLDAEGTPIPGLYASGWAKRGPVGLIGSTKSDSLQTVTHLLEDLAEAPRTGREGDPLARLLAETGLEPVDWEGWLRVDRRERELGEARGRERIKIPDRPTLTSVARAAAEATTTV
ncbi:FAD-dependent oxidoreductase [Demequina zhanjiangensis]|uniref:ferredoxin--NADP(+) reductase n=1 Tax=Demequina zhanjiangensis TaxID=3051659 RepID=A0ABT8G3V1_9MICO|nr:FAD-dependent oxidoreductase [Demequina sp. SYSU T00b26]MDN4473818.1 FAD-dependent oxidoreductase [Demequina sp. SYSU T00b26]